MSEFKEKAIAGISWSVVSQVGRQGLIFGFGVVLARLLSPRAFGLLAMVTVVTNFAQRFFDLGFGAALVQHQDVREEHLSSIFWINVGAGVVLTGLFVLAAPLFGAFYGEPLLVPLASVLAFSFLVTSMSVVQRTLLEKHLDFKTLSMVEVGSVALASVVGVAMAYDGWGVWSLVARNLLMGFLAMGLLWGLSDWRPRFSFSGAAVRELTGFSLHLLGTRSMNYWVRNLDDLLVGRVIGSGALGIYNRAYAVMLFPLQNVSHVIARVMFPSFSTIQGQQARVKRIYLKITRVIALVTFPLMLGLLATTEPLVVGVFGEPWAGMIPILRILAGLGMVQSIVTLNGAIFLSQGRADLQFRLSLFVKPWLIAGILVGVWGGTAVSVAAGYGIASFTAAYPNLRVSGGLIGLSVGALARNLSGVFGCAAAMSALVFGAGLLLPDGWPHGAYLAVQVPLGIVVYGALLHLLDVRAYREGRVLLEEQWARRAAR